MTVKNKAYIVAMALGCLLLTAGYASFAQAQEMEDEFAAFKAATERRAAPVETTEETAPAEPAAQPVEEAQTQAAPAPAPAEDPLAALLKAAESGGSANPLGQAANLPVAGTMPGAAYGVGTYAQTPEEVAAQMEAEAQAQEEKMRQKAFEKARDGLLPLTVDQTREVLQVFHERREASETPFRVPEARTTVQNISLDPSGALPVVHTAPGYVTTIAVLDASGAPWPIQDVTWAGKFDVTPPEEGGHVIRITPKVAHGMGNISLRLVDLVTPVTLSIQTGLDVVDYRYDARIGKQGPLAKTPLIEYGGISAVAGTDEDMIRLLDGVALGDGAEKIKLEGVDGATTAYRIRDKIYLRTPLTLLSPAWNASATSADGTNVYALYEAPVILLSDRGRMVKARVATSETGY